MVIKALGFGEPEGPADAKLGCPPELEVTRWGNDQGQFLQRP